MKLYEVAGGWQAQDDDLAMACFGHDPEEAKKALQAARDRAKMIAERMAAIEEVDEPLDADELGAVKASLAELDQEHAVGAR